MPRKGDPNLKSRLTKLNAYDTRQLENKVDKFNIGQMNISQLRRSDPSLSIKIRLCEQSIKLQQNLIGYYKDHRHYNSKRLQACGEKIADLQQQIANYKKLAGELNVRRSEIIQNSDRLRRLYNNILESNIPDRKDKIKDLEALADRYLQSQSIKDMGARTEKMRGIVADTEKLEDSLKSPTSSSFRP